jgi:hypothetical protein
VSYYRTQEFDALWSLTIRVPNEAVAGFIAERLPLQRWGAGEAGDSVPDEIAQQMRGWPLERFLCRKGVGHSALRRKILFSDGFTESEKHAAVCGPLRLSWRFTRVLSSQAHRELVRMGEPEALTLAQWRSLHNKMPGDEFVLENFVRKRASIRPDTLARKVARFLLVVLLACGAVDITWRLLSFMRHLILAR